MTLTTVSLASLFASAASLRPSHVSWCGYTSWPSVAPRSSVLMAEKKPGTSSLFGGLFGSGAPSANKHSQDAVGAASKQEDSYSSLFGRLSSTDREKVDLEKQELKASLRKLTLLPEAAISAAAEFAKERVNEAQERAARVAAMPGEALQEAEATVEEVKATVEAARLAMVANEAAAEGRKAVEATRLAAEESIRAATAAAAAKKAAAREVALNAARVAEQAAAAAVAVKVEADAEAAAAAEAAQRTIEEAEAEAVRLAEAAEAAQLEAQRIADAPKRKLAAARKSLSEAQEAAAAAATAAAEAYEAAKPGLQATAQTAKRLASEVAKSEATLAAMAVVEVAKDSAMKSTGSSQSIDNDAVRDETLAAEQELEEARQNLAEAKAQLAQMAPDNAETEISARGTADTRTADTPSAVLLEEEEGVETEAEEEAEADVIDDEEEGGAEEQDVDSQEADGALGALTEDIADADGLPIVAPIDLGPD